jgi:hypothetical protein
MTSDLLQFLINSAITYPTRHLTSLLTEESARRMVCTYTGQRNTEARGYVLPQL